MVFPITPAVREILFPLQGQHPEFVFTYVAIYGNRRLGRVRGQRYPLTYNGAKTAWQRLRANSGVDNFRFHDFRHDFGTKLLRDSGNLKLVQKALNHRDIKSTLRYAHVLDEDVAAAVERLAKSRKKSRSKVNERQANMLRNANDIGTRHTSFQMSFAATLGLVALVQIGMPHLFAAPDNSATARMALWGGREVAMLALASLVAGLATMPYAAFHFHRVTPYGVLANLAAMPVVSALVMPAGLFGMAAMPFGFDGVFWQAMGWGIDWMIAVAQWVAALPGAIGRIAAFGTGPLISASLGIILLGLLRTPLRWAGAAALGLAVVWALATPRPDMLISADGHTIGVRGRDGRLHLIRAARDSSRDSFLLREWLAADADGRPAADASLSEGVSCDQAGCVAQLADGGLVALALQPDALADDCERAALLVTTRQAPAACGALVVDQDRLRRQGALALRRSRDGFAVEAVRPAGRRPAVVAGGGGRRGG